MTIKKIRELPSDLPHARLYLDDVEEISTILLDAYTPVLAEFKKEAKITYTVRDSQMDSIEDLQARGGSSANLEIRVNPWGGSVRFHGFYSNPSTILSSDLKDQAWIVYSKIKAIFDGRQLNLKNALSNLPSWLKFSWYVVIVGFGAALEDLHLHSSRNEAFLVTGYLILAALGAYVVFWPSRVYFIRSHEHSKISSAIRRGYVRDIIFLVIGAAIAELVRHFGDRFLK